MFSCSKSRKRATKTYINNDNFEKTLIEILEQQNVPIPDDIDYNIAGGFYNVQKEFIQYISTCVTTFYDKKIHMPDMLDKITFNPTTNEHELRIPMQFYQWDGVGNNKIKSVEGLGPTTIECCMKSLALQQGYVQSPEYMNCYGCIIASEKGNE